ncbi:hypothetical protein L596_007152 [Steinernema carpocapsae]|uniref:BHLH domain-containing protein n=1 Tax=Steinernema carpocapsae TaxID=34508 RepID=A0A4U5P9F6_STECR|nr:hypothetical protein L596_007152 [Steinernema carpocapsae]
MSGHVLNRKEKKKNDEEKRRKNIGWAKDRLKKTLDSVRGSRQGSSKRPQENVASNVYLAAIELLTALWEQHCQREQIPDALQSLSVETLKQKFNKHEGARTQCGGKENRKWGEKLRRNKEKLCITYLKKLIVVIKPELHTQSKLEKADVIKKTEELISEFCISENSPHILSRSTPSLAYSMNPMYHLPSSPPCFMKPIPFHPTISPVHTPLQHFMPSFPQAMYMHLPPYPYSLMTPVQSSPSDSGISSSTSSPESPQRSRKRKCSTEREDFVDVVGNTNCPKKPKMKTKFAVWQPWY